MHSEHFKVMPNFSGKGGWLRLKDDTSAECPLFICKDILRSICKSPRKWDVIFMEGGRAHYDSMEFMERVRFYSNLYQKSNCIQMSNRISDCIQIVKNIMKYSFLNSI